MSTSYELTTKVKALVSRHPRITDSFSTTLERGVKAQLFLRSPSAVFECALEVARSERDHRVFVATVPDRYQAPIMANPPDHITLDRYALGRSVEFGPSQTIRGLFLLPSMAHGEVYGAAKPPSDSAMACLGTVSLSGDAALISFRMPHIPYGDLDCAWVGITADAGS